MTRIGWKLSRETNQTKKIYIETRENLWKSILKVFSQFTK